MRAAGLLLVLIGVIGIVVGVLALLGVGFLQPTPNVGDVRMPGAGPIIAGVILLAAGLAITTSRVKV